jgi:hypothetical protein
MVHDISNERKQAALDDFYGADVPASTVDRVIVRDLDDDLRHPFVD